MLSDDFYQLGHICKRHGLAGELIVELDVTDPHYYHNTDILFLREGHELIPYFVKKISITSNKARVALEDIYTPNQADNLVGKQVFLPIKHLPKLENGEYYYHDLIGFDVIEKGKVLGKVSKIYDLGTQHLLAFNIKDKEVLIPINQDIVTKVDLVTQQVNMKIPNGLIDIYLG